MMRAALLMLLWTAMPHELRGQTELPAIVAQQLNRSYPGWHFATLAAAHRTSLPPAASPASIRGDFDGDGHTDYVVQVVTRRGLDSLQQVIAFLRRGANYLPYVADSFPVSTVAYLVRAPANAERTDFDADPDGGSHVRLARDGIDIVFAEAAASTCLYRAAAFRCIVSGD